MRAAPAKRGRRATPQIISARLSERVTLVYTDERIVARFDDGYSINLGPLSAAAADRAQELRTGLPLASLQSRGRTTKEGKQSGWLNSDTDLIRLNLDTGDQCPQRYRNIGAAAIGERVCDFLCPPHQLLHAPDIQLHMLQCLEHRGAVGQELSNPFDDAAFHLSRRNTNAVRGV